MTVVQENRTIESFEQLRNNTQFSKIVDMKNSSAPISQVESLHSVSKILAFGENAKKRVLVIY